MQFICGLTPSSSAHDDEKASGPAIFSGFRGGGACFVPSPGSTWRHNEVGVSSRLATDSVIGYCERRTGHEQF